MGVHSDECLMFPLLQTSGGGGCAHYDPTPTVQKGAGGANSRAGRERRCRTCGSVPVARPGGVRVARAWLSMVLRVAADLRVHWWAIMVLGAPTVLACTPLAPRARRWDNRHGHRLDGGGGCCGHVRPRMAHRVEHHRRRVCTRHGDRRPRPSTRLVHGQAVQQRTCGYVTVVFARAQAIAAYGYTDVLDRVGSCTALFSLGALAVLAFLSDVVATFGSRPADRVECPRPAV